MFNDNDLKLQVFSRIYLVYAKNLEYFLSVLNTDVLSGDYFYYGLYLHVLK